MLHYLLKRLLLMVPMLLGISLISFAVIHLAPGEPGVLEAEMNPKVTKEVRERIRAYYGLDKPLYVQYLLWAKRIVKLDFGPVLRVRQKARDRQDCGEASRDDRH